MNGEIQFVAKALEQVNIATALVTEGEGGAHAETVHAAEIADQRTHEHLARLAAERFIEMNQ